MIWLVPTGGGGLAAGIGASLESRLGERHEAVMYGVQSEASPFMHTLFRGKSQASVADLPSLADGLAGPVEEKSLTIPMVKQYAQDVILVTEEEIGKAIGYSAQRYQERIEGSAAVCLAAVLSGKITQRPAILVISGGNIGDEIYGLYA